MKFLDLVWEVGSLRRIKRAPVKSPFQISDSVAEHSHRVAFIAAYLAKLEGANEWIWAAAEPKH